MQPERVVLFRPRTVLQVAGVLLGVAIALWVVWISRRVISWVLVAFFLALALDPAVRFLQARGMRRRGAAAAVIYVAAIAIAALLAALLVPPLVDQADGLAEAAPGYVSDLTAGRGPLGFLERDYQIVEKVREATKGNGSVLGGASTFVQLGRGVLTAIVGFMTIVFLTLFMILEGPAWTERCQQLENHVLQPLVYGRTVQLSPLVVLIAILVGTEVAGILGALGAIPIAGTLQILLIDWLEHRRMRDDDGGPAAVAAESLEEVIP